MNISQFAEHVFEDLEPCVSAVRLSKAGDLILELDCDDWNASDGRRQFELICASVHYSNVRTGLVGSITFSSDHPVLMEHVGAQGALYFASSPDRPSDVFLATHEVISKETDGWLEPSRFLNGSPSEIHSYLRHGNGMLACGPLALLAAIQQRLSGMMQLSLVQTRVEKEVWKALVVGKHWIICKAVSVIERANG